MVAGVAVLAFAARLVPVLRGGGLDGIYGYDDGVYFTGAASLIAGRLPYADFTFLHPPGILLALAPFAELGRLTSDHVGLAVARLAFMALGALNAALLSLLGRRLLPGRAALAPAAAAGVFYALWFSSIYATRTTLLEGLGTTTLLVALVLVWRRDSAPSPAALLCAGAALGAGAGTKIWGLVPLVVVALWASFRYGRAALLRMTVGAAAAGVAICGPFFMAAPSAMSSMVVLDQLHRPPSTPSLVTRGLDASSLHWNLPNLTGGAAVLALVVLTLVLLSASGAAWRAGGALPVLLLVSSAVTLAAGPSYFTHYGEFVAAPLSLVLAGAVAAVVAAIRGRRSVLLAVLLPLMTLMLVAELPTVARTFGRPLDASSLTTAIASARCVATDIPSTLAITDSLSRGLAVGCAVPVDLTGALYGRFRVVGPDGRALPRRQNGPWQAHLLAYLQSADAQVFVNPPSTVLNRHGVQELLRGNKLDVHEGAIRVYRRR